MDGGGDIDRVEVAAVALVEREDVVRRVVGSRDLLVQSDVGNNANSTADADGILYMNFPASMDLVKSIGLMDITQELTITVTYDSSYTDGQPSTFVVEPVIGGVEITV